MLTGLDIEGNSLLHRVPVRAKLVLLFVAATVLLLTSTLWALGPAAVFATLLYLSTGIGVAEAFRRVRFVLFTVALLALANLVFHSAEEAAAVLLRLTALVLLAAAITATTGISAFMDEITWCGLPMSALPSASSFASCRKSSRVTRTSAMHTRQGASRCVR